MEEESGEKVISRLEDEVERLRQEDDKKSCKISEMEQRLVDI